MKNILKFLMIIFSTVFLIQSCQTVEEVDFPTRNKSVVNIVNSSVSVLEGDTAVIEISTDQPYAKDLIFKLVQIGGDAQVGVDYDFASYSAPDYGPIGGRIVVPAYQSTGSLTVSGLTDFAIDNKSATFELRPMESMNGVAGPNKTVTLTIEDYTEDNLSIVLSWEVSNPDEAVCDQDLDLYLVDSTDTELSHSWFDCPEQVTLLASEADGEYFVDVDYWSPSATVNVPGDPNEFFVKYVLTIGKVGVSSQVFSNDFTDPTASNLSDNWSGTGGNGYRPHVVKITKTGTDYTLE